ncbi:MAG TPA: hypothetical protein VN973_12045 [Candidatus Dormibacteraeota bacterium]|nr:hypothetical protein [Candidatus Dormibacteraeota bacterium]
MTLAELHEPTTVMAVGVTLAMPAYVALLYRTGIATPVPEL